jgi:hypothetical protein
MRARNSNISLQVCCTVNVFNVLYLADVANWIHTQSFDYVYWNMLHDAPWLSVAYLPDSAKKQVADHLLNNDFPMQYHTELKKIIEFMMLGSSTDGTEIIKNIQHLDHRRNQSLNTVSPKLAGVLKYE